MVEFWTDHFNTDLNSVGILKTADVRDVLRLNALGTFPEMLNAQAMSPAMINRLNNQQNSRTAPNQNYAREVMELHTLGVTGGYTHQDIVDVARCFTGWRYVTTSGAGESRNFLFNQNVHDIGTNSCSATRSPAGRERGSRSGGSSRSTRRPAGSSRGSLLRWFIDYEPSEELIADVAEAFRQSNATSRPCCAGC